MEKEIFRKMKLTDYMIGDLIYKRNFNIPKWLYEDVNSNVLERVLSLLLNDKLIYHEKDRFSRFLSNLSWKISLTDSIYETMIWNDKFHSYIPFLLKSQKHWKRFGYLMCKIVEEEQDRLSLLYEVFYTGQQIHSSVFYYMSKEEVFHFFIKRMDEEDQVSLKWEPPREEELNVLSRLFFKLYLNKGFSKSNENTVEWFKIKFWRRYGCSYYPEKFGEDGVYKYLYFLLDSGYVVEISDVASDIIRENKLYNNEDFKPLIMKIISVNINNLKCLDWDANIDYITRLDDMVFQGTMRVPLYRYDDFKRVMNIATPFVPPRYVSGLVTSNSYIGSLNFLQPVDWMTPEMVNSILLNPYGPEFIHSYWKENPKFSDFMMNRFFINSNDVVPGLLKLIILGGKKELKERSFILHQLISSYGKLELIKQEPKIVLYLKLYSKEVESILQYAMEEHRCEEIIPYMDVTCFTETILNQFVFHSDFYVPFTIDDEDYPTNAKTVQNYGLEVINPSNDNSYSKWGFEYILDFAFRKNVTIPE